MFLKNSEKSVILDASALITLLARETGWEKVLEILPNSIISSVNYAEVAKFLIEYKSYTQQQVSQTINSLISDIIPFDEKLALISAKIITHVKKLGLSLGDRACLSLGISLNVPIYTADRIWGKLDDIGVKIVIIR